MSRLPIKRCAIYTRKSSDEGLDQSFNSLDAQREAGEAFAKSQAHEGWRPTTARYDDGGYSGGTMERPGLQQLLADIKAGSIDVVVVYKIDRLTRSLADFARIVELFDEHEVSFVSVTQAFNTTSSMGRLTLNVLLSFAQFEREVTGERIRDKIAASKKKGMWMGGVPPLGYDIPAAGTRTLQVNEAEARTVRSIFARYLELGSVHQLERDLRAAEIHSKRRVTVAGKAIGGEPFSRGALFYLLRNRIYLGKIVHKGEVYDGEHPAIVNADVFAKAGAMLDANTRRHQGAADRRVVRAPLTGKLFDESGAPMTPTFSRGRSGKVHRYYVSAALQQGTSKAVDSKLRRLPAAALETILLEAIDRWQPGSREPWALISKVSVSASGLNIDLPIDGAGIDGRLTNGERLLHSSRKRCSVSLPIAFPLRGGARVAVAGTRISHQPDLTLVKALRKAHRMIERGSDTGPICSAAPASPYDRKILRLAFLDPAIQRDILAGRQPADINLEAIMAREIPLGWNAQRKVLNWPST